MRIITINLPENYLEAIQALTNNRSEFIREALAHFLEREMDFKNRLNYPYLRNLVRINNNNRGEID